MKTEDDFFSYREWKEYLEEQQMKQELEENPDAANSNAAVKSIDRSLKGASSLASATLKSMFLPSDAIGKS